jgi:hypothetical protein
VTKNRTKTPQHAIGVAPHQDKAERNAEPNPRFENRAPERNKKGTGEAGLIRRNDDAVRGVETNVRIHEVDMRKRKEPQPRKSVIQLYQRRHLTRTIASILVVKEVHVLLYSAESSDGPASSPTTQETSLRKTQLSDTSVLGFCFTNVVHSGIILWRKYPVFCYAPNTRRAIYSNTRCLVWEHTF